MTATLPLVPGIAGDRPGELTVLYDWRCPLCRRLRQWMQTQPTLVPVTMLAADSPAAHQRFPALDHPRTTRVLTVVAADGAVYEGERAWLVCGWSLPAWRPLVEHVGDGPRIHLVRAAAHLVDAYRHRSMAGRPTAGCSRCVIATPDPNWPPPAWEARRASGDR